MPMASSGAASATAPSPWLRERTPAPAGRARGSLASGGGSWTLPQARERAMARADHVRLLAGLTASPRLGKQSLGFAVLAAMISSVLFGEPFLLRLGTVFLGYFPLFDYHI